MSFNDEIFKEERERFRRLEEIESQNRAKAQAKARYEKEFETVNRREVAAWPDEKLAAWQARFPCESPQFILAQYEWSRRLTADQIKAARWAAWVGLGGVILGAVLARILEKI
jgi:uncharacterized membrane protein YcjF (UPF0283 family)